MAGGNLRVVLKRQRDGLPAPDDFAVAEGPMPQPGPDQVLVRNIYLSLDMFIRKAMRGDHYGYALLNPGDVIHGDCVARVVRSQHADFKPGDVVVADSGWQHYAVIDASKVKAGVDPLIAPLSTAVGVLGMPGLTAWASVTHMLKPALGATIAVSAAAGPVGAVVGQLAKRNGARVVGIAGSAEKCQVVTRTYGFDACVNYKTPDWEEALKDACPHGIDGYHDNVGGTLLQAVGKHLNPYATVVMCGRPNDYHAPGHTGIQLGAFIVKRAKLRGLVVYDFAHEFDHYLSVAAPLVREGTLKVKEDHVSGLENAIPHFIKLCRAENVGKAIVAVGPEKA
jgi:NADPH-dependent curcumin reductase CurA